MQAGTGEIELILAADFVASVSWHQLTFENDQQPAICVYLVDVLAPRMYTFKLPRRNATRISHGVARFS